MPALHLLMHHIDKLATELLYGTRAVKAVYPCPCPQAPHPNREAPDQTRPARADYECSILKKHSKKGLRISEPSATPFPSQFRAPGHLQPPRSAPSASALLDVSREMPSRPAQNTQPTTSSFSSPPETKMIGVPVIDMLGERRPRRSAADHPPDGMGGKYLPALPSRPCEVHQV